MAYEFNFGGVDGVASLDFLNLLDSDQELKLEERAETGSGTPNQFYGLAKNWQTPRSVRLALTLKF